MNAVGIREWAKTHAVVNMNEKVYFDGELYGVITDRGGYGNDRFVFRTRGMTLFTCATLAEARRTAHDFYYSI